MSDLAVFLLARIAEDEKRYARDRSEYGYGWQRMVAECAAKRQIVEMGGSECGGRMLTKDAAEFRAEFGFEPYAHYPDGYAPGCDGCSAAQAADYDHQRVLRALATVYADYHDYDEAWRP